MSKCRCETPQTPPRQRFPRSDGRRRALQRNVETTSTRFCQTRVVGQIAMPMVARRPRLAPVGTKSKRSAAARRRTSDRRRRTRHTHKARVYSPSVCQFTSVFAFYRIFLRGPAGAAPCLVPRRPARRGRDARRGASPRGSGGSRRPSASRLRDVTRHVASLVPHPMRDNDARPLCQPGGGDTSGRTP